MKILSQSLALLTTMFLFPAAMAAQPQCIESTLEVNLSDQDPETYQVKGTLCYETTPVDKTVQLLMSGSTYAQYYFDSPKKPNQYSYVRSATERCYATFNFDRIGNGKSDKPDGNAIGMEVQAHVTHQVVEALRNGLVGGTAFAKVMVVGHSMGSFVAFKYAAMYPGEANGNVLTGFLHDVNMETVNEFGPLLMPAADVPKFASKYSAATLANYVTSVPDSRVFFYHEPSVEDVILNMDEDLKQTVSTAELDEGPGVLFTEESLDLESPTLVMLGEFDDLFCRGLNNVDCSNPTEVQAYEEAFYTSKACLQTEVIFGSGHCINLHINALDAFDKIHDWADEYVGVLPGPPNTICN